MTIYFDPSVLIAFYLPEERTLELRQWVAGERLKIGLNVWQEIEFKNSARQKVMRGEATAGDLARMLRVFDDDCIHGRVVRKTVSWAETFSVAERLSKRHATLLNCRAFDLVHVAI